MPLDLQAFQWWVASRPCPKERRSYMFYYYYYLLICKLCESNCLT